MKIGEYMPGQNRYQVSAAGGLWEWLADHVVGVRRVLLAALAAAAVGLLVWCNGCPEASLTAEGAECSAVNPVGGAK